MELALAAAAVLAGQLVKGITGFGSALVAVPLLSFLFEPATAILLVAGSDVFGGLWLVWDARKRVAFTLVLGMLVPVILGQWVGTDLLMVLPEQTVRIVLATVIAVFAVDMIWRPVKQRRGTLTSMPTDRPGLYTQAGIAGLLGGVMAGLVGAGGPPLVVFVRRHFVDAFARAQLIAVFLPAAIVLAVMLVAKDAAPAGELWRLVVLGPAVLVGGVVGARLSGKVAPAPFGRLTGALLLVTAVGLPFAG